VAVAGDRHLQLGADAVGGGDQQRIGKAGGAQIEQRAKAAQVIDNAGAPGGLRQRPDLLDQPSARVDIDACLLVREPADGFLRATC